MITTPVPKAINKISNFRAPAGMAPVLTFHEKHIGKEIEATSILSVPQSDVYLLRLEYVESVHLCNLNTRYK
jgi:hypothetical protein